ncbi:methyltransferase domain-containing protein [Marinoscillum furvescens]|uniref:Methyltransferase family protein n=1 Tax=Marinoscillum furvescens DSM 4134 TaxID=1122208 RepID=A0A3D9L488_MARFU|nr:methyltransferase domain-containing protein [Marinoscillum furvescens]REE00392.1 methyltransferase family protein [Marinoscillum furvescens DSM 4134]
MNLKYRASEEEIMDDLNLSGQVIDQTLRELDYINRTLGGNAISLSAFKKLLKGNEIQSVADLGCGGADILIEMAKIARKQYRKVKFTGIDANPHIVNYAQGHTKSWPEIEVQCHNIFSEDFQQQHFDIIHCCLFLHHFTHGELVQLFRSFSHQARVAIVVNDLHRHLLAYHSIRLLTRFFSKSYMVRNDAALSVARGFKKHELKAILHEAEIQNYELKWRWAFRWQLVITL